MRIHASYITIGRHMSSTNSSFNSRWGSEPHLTRGSLDPLESLVTSANGISIGPAVFLQLTRVPDTQAHRPRYVRRL